MKVRFHTQKITSLSDYFSIGFHKDVEEDYSFCIMLFGRDYVWRFFKKDSHWSVNDWCVECGEEWEQA